MTVEELSLICQTEQITEPGHRAIEENWLLGSVKSQFLGDTALSRLLVALVLAGITYPKFDLHLTSPLRHPPKEQGTENLFRDVMYST